MKALFLVLVSLAGSTFGYQYSYPIFRKRPGVEEKGIGESVKFRCQVDRDQQNVYWEFKGHRIRENEFFKIKSLPHISILSINNIAVELEGSYCCCLNTGPKVWPVCGSLFVRRVPHVTSGPVSRMVKHGDRVIFSCTVDAFPTPAIGWFHNNTAMCQYQINEECTLDSSKTSTTGYLKIYSVFPNDAGFYKCNAVNDHGSSFSQSALLTVEENTSPPEIEFEEAKRVIEHQDMTTVGGRRSTLSSASISSVATKEGLSEVTTPSTGVISYYHQSKMNMSGYTIFTLNEVTYHDKIGSPNSTLLIVLFLGVSLIVMILIFLYCVNRLGMSSRRANAAVNKALSTRDRKRTASRPSSRINLERLYYSVEKLEIIQELGEGVFGLVFKARAPGLLSPDKTTTVAVKTIRTEGRMDEDSQVEDFNREAELLATFKHENIIQLLGICLNKDLSIDSNISCLLFEYMEGGDLCAYLRNRGPNRTMFSTLTNDGNNEDISEMNKISICTQIACGMKYLSERNFIHRDLATRNCLISGKDYIVKIADFGLSRRTYQSDYYKAGDTESVPIRWMSPEAILYGKYSSQSDVWAFGVTLWEVYTYGLQPFFSLTNEEVICCICKNTVLPPPPGVPSWMFNLMQLCWQRAPEQRPSFAVVHSVLKAILLNNGTLPLTEGLPEAENDKSNEIEYSSILFVNDSDDSSKSSPKISQEYENFIPPPKEFRSDSLFDKKMVSAGGKNKATTSTRLNSEHGRFTADGPDSAVTYGSTSQGVEAISEPTATVGYVQFSREFPTRRGQLADCCKVFGATNSRGDCFYPSLQTPGARSDSCLPDSPISCRSNLYSDSEESVV